MSAISYAAVFADVVTWLFSLYMIEPHFTMYYNRNSRKVTRKRGVNIKYMVVLHSGQHVFVRARNPDLGLLCADGRRRIIATTQNLPGMAYRHFVVHPIR